MQVFVEVNLHVVAVARQVVAGEVNKHHMLGVLFRVVAQIFCSLTVFLCVARSFGCPCNRVDVSAECAFGVVCLDAAVSLGR